MRKPVEKGTRLYELYQREPTFLFSGVEAKHHFQAAYDAGVRDFLMSILHIKNMVKTEEMDRRFSKGDCRLLVDSATFTFHNNYEEYGDKRKYPLTYWENFIEEYLQWVREHADYVTAFVELDITGIVGVEQVKKWRKKYFEPFSEEMGIPVLIMWQPQYSMKEWEDMCKRYHYVGFSGEAGIPDRQMIRMLQIARKHNTLVHLMAFTKVDKLRSGRYPYASTDSVSWKAAEHLGGSKPGNIGERPLKDNTEMMAGNKEPVTHRRA